MPVDQALAGFGNRGKPRVVRLLRQDPFDLRHRANAVARVDADKRLIRKILV